MASSYSFGYGECPEFLGAFTAHKSIITFRSPSPAQNKFLTLFCVTFDVTLPLAVNPLGKEGAPFLFAFVILLTLILDMIFLDIYI